MLVFTARHLLPVASPPVRGAAVAVEGGRVVACGRRKDVLKSAGAGAEVRDLGEVALLPGLVNAHAHLELSWMEASRPPAGDFVPWVRALLERRAQVDPQAARAAADAAAARMVARGTIAVGDVCNDGWAVETLAASRLEGIAFLEIVGFRSGDAERLLEASAARLDGLERSETVTRARDRLRVVLTPHAAHTVSHPLLRALAGRALASHEPLSIHVAESGAETEMLLAGTGPLADLLRERGQWEDGWKAPGQSPVEYLDRIGVLTPATLAVHCVHVGQHDISRLQARGVTVVTCPRSNAALGVGKAPVPKLLGSGIPVALGTDSLASSPDLDLFAEMAALRREHPGLAPAAVLRMATANGARALGLTGDWGTIEAGKRARFVAVSLSEPDDDPLEVVTTCPPDVAAIEP